MPHPVLLTEIDRDDENLRIVCKLLEVSTSESMSAENTRILHFMKEQIKLLKMKQIRYSADTLIWATTIYFSFPLMENSKLLKLPHPRHLKTVLIRLDTENSNLSSSHIKYFTEKLKKLDENAKFVTLMLDEIYVKKNISYKDGKIVRADIQSVDTNSSITAASTIQTFMISSIYCQQRRRRPFSSDKFKM
jgi:hypothetical protein